MNVIQAVAVSDHVCIVAVPRMQLGAAAVQEGMVIWDARGSSDCRVGLVLPREQAKALRCALQHALQFLWAFPFCATYCIAFYLPL